MKFSIDREGFARAVAWVDKAAAKNPVLPIMTGMLIDVDEAAGTVSLAAYDYEVSAHMEVPAQVVDGGDCLVPSAVLAKVISVLDGKVVEVVTDDATMTVRCDGDEFTLPLMASHDYPTLPGHGDLIGQVDAADLERAFKQAGHATGAEKAGLMALTGVSLTVAGSVLTVVSTDRYRLPATEIPWDSQGSGGDHSVVVPPAAIRDFLHGAKGPIQVALTMADSGEPVTIGFECGGRQSTARLIADTFPGWRRFIPQTDNVVTLAEVETAVFLAALKKAQAVDASGPAVTVRMAIGADGILLTGGERTKLSTRFAAEVSGDAVEVRVNLKYIVDAVAGAGADQVRLAITAPRKPMLLTAASEEDVTHWHVLMPMGDSQG